MARGCDGPVQLVHGRVQDHILNSERALEFQCDKGFSLVGDHLVVCLGGNTWSSAFPTCQREIFLDLTFFYFVLSHLLVFKAGKTKATVVLQIL